MSNCIHSCWRGFRRATRSHRSILCLIPGDGRFKQDILKPGMLLPDPALHLESLVTPRQPQLAVGIVGLAALVFAESAAAHGMVGNRYFPATLAIEDPFVADEISLPTVSSMKMPAMEDEPRSRETEISVEYAKRITPSLGLSIEQGWTHLNPHGESSHSGFNNLELAPKYQFFESDLHETVLSLQLNWEVGDTGSQRVDADSFSTWTPALLFGKGFGDLPDNLAALKPLAVTGVVGVTLPTKSQKTQLNDDGEFETEQYPHTLQWGLALQYSIPYLQSSVRDVGIPQPLNRLIPLVEMVFETPLDRGGGTTTGTINPGVIWIGKSFQLGLEAVIPINDSSGRGVGVLGQLHFYLDDLFPRSLGRPIFEKP